MKINSWPGSNEAEEDTTASRQLERGGEAAGGVASRENLYRTYDVGP